MMKKHGFTLAEVLITLAIIGVVATLTLPSLMSNTGEQQALTAYKKIINTLTEAGQMNAAINGFDYASANGAGEGGTVSFNDGNMTLSAIFNDRLQVNHNAGNGTYQSSVAADNKCTSLTFTLRDGTGICLTSGGAQAEYYNIYVDTNGPKGPNRVSTCTNTGCTGGTASKHIFDQFPVVLHGGTAIPGKWSALGTESDDTETRAALYAMGISRQSGSGS